MSHYDHVVYKNYGHLLSYYFGSLKSIFKKEVYKDSYEIYTPSQFKAKYPFAVLPLNSVAVLWMSFEYDTIDGKKEHSRFCCLDSSGYRIPDNSLREFNDRVDTWLEQVYILRERKKSKN